jgi:hypothetical protein
VTAHQLARALLALTQDTPVMAWDPDAGDWQPVTGFTFGGLDPVRLHTDTDEEEA